MNRALAPLLLLVVACHVPVEDDPPPQGPPIAIVNPELIVLRSMADSSVIIDLRHLDPRTAELDESPAPNGGMEYGIFIRTTDEGSRLLGQWSAANVGRQIGVYLDGRLIATPTLESRVDDAVFIKPIPTRAEADAVMARLKRGGA